MNNMADSTNLKSWLVKKFFSIPDWENGQKPTGTKAHWDKKKKIMIR